MLIAPVEGARSNTPARELSNRKSPWPTRITLLLNSQPTDPSNPSNPWFPVRCVYDPPTSNCAKARVGSTIRANTKITAPRNNMENLQRDSSNRLLVPDQALAALLQALRRTSASERLVIALHDDRLPSYTVKMNR